MDHDQCGACGTPVEWTRFFLLDRPGDSAWILAATTLPDALRPGTCRANGGLHGPRTDWTTVGSPVGGERPESPSTAVHAERRSRSEPPERGEVSPGD